MERAGASGFSRDSTNAWIMNAQAICVSYDDLAHGAERWGEDPPLHPRSRSSITSSVRRLSPASGFEGRLEEPPPRGVSVAEGCDEHAKPFVDLRSSGGAVRDDEETV